MKTHLSRILAFVLLPALLLPALLLGACTPPAASSTGLKVLAVENILADITQHIAGERLSVDTLIPPGLDPHTFESTPQDVARIADSQVLILNGAGLEEWLDEILDNAGGERLVIEASAGLESRVPSEEELELMEQAHEGETHSDEDEHEGEAHAHEIDPHFWLDPQMVIRYAENIRDGLIQVDPTGKEEYTHNTDLYIQQLKELDGWILSQVQQIPPERRLLVTNHESFGYFADRYGFRVVGAIIPSVSSSATPSAQQLAALIERIRATGAPAIFLETGANPDLAEQLAQETGARVVTSLSTHSLTPVDGKPSGYIALMRDNTEKIVAALK